jgi:hypothetical protein
MQNFELKIEPEEGLSKLALVPDMGVAAPIKLVASPSFCLLPFLFLLQT